MALIINFPFNVRYRLLKPVYERINGVMQVSYDMDSEPEYIFCSVRSYGGTERTINGEWSIRDTLTVQTYYRPDITAQSAIMDESGAIWRMLNTPENVDMKNKFLQFKVERVKGDG